MMTGHPESPQSASPSEGPSFPVKCEPQSDSDDCSHHGYYDATHGHASLLPQVTRSSFESEIPSLPNELVAPLEATVHTLQNTNGSQQQSHMLQHLQRVTMGALETEFSPPVPLPPSATPVAHVKLETRSPEPLLQPHASGVKLESLELHEQGTTLDMDRHMTVHGRTPGGSLSAVDFLPLHPVKDEPLSEGEQQLLSGEDTNDSSNAEFPNASGTQAAGGSALGTGPKTWTQQDMDNALEALRSHNMSLTKASATYGIPSTTLWQRAHRLGIDTPKKEGSSKTWSEADLHNALHALRTGAISANKASKAYGIPSSTLYKIARREGIRLAAPFNAAPTAWRPSDLERALHSIRSGLNSVQRASTEFGIPTGTLYGRCKREGIELSRSNPTPWSEDAMGEALEAVRVGQMSINQAAIHYNLPYSSLYGRFKRCKYEPEPGALHRPLAPVHHAMQNPQPMVLHPHMDSLDPEQPDAYAHYPQHDNPHPHEHQHEHPHLHPQPHPHGYAHAAHYPYEYAQYAPQATS